MNSEEKKKVLFVCLGNICRSPMAMAIFRELTWDYDCDSVALGSWHVGNPPDSRAVAVLKNQGIDLVHSARQVTRQDFYDFDFIMGMDPDNVKSLQKMAPPGTLEKIHLITEYDPEGAERVPDPYYDSGNEGFNLCYEILERSLKNFLNPKGCSN